MCTHKTDLIIDEIKKQETMTFSLYISTRCTLSYNMYERLKCSDAKIVHYNDKQAFS